MVRRNKDGFVRFSSYNDLSRALSSFSTATVVAEMDKIIKSDKNRVVALLAAQDYLDDIIYINSMALSSCYASDVVATIPEGVNAASMRNEFCERIRAFITNYNACEGQLSMLATMAANKAKLQLPKSYLKALAACKTSVVTGSWQYMQLKDDKKSQILCHVTKLQEAECASSDNTEYSSDKLVGFFYANSKRSKAGVFYDDSIGRGKTRAKSLQIVNVASGNYKKCLREFSLKIA